MEGSNLRSLIALVSRDKKNRYLFRRSSYCECAQRSEKNERESVHHDTYRANLLSRMYESENLTLKSENISRERDKQNTVIEWLSYIIFVVATFYICCSKAY